MAITQLPTDFKDLLRFLNKNGVEYLLVGGYAVNYYGYSRMTGDIDFWIAQNSENVAKVVTTLHEFGFGSANVSPEVFLEPGRTIRMGNPPLRVEFQTTITGVQFSECWTARIVTEMDGVSINIISLDDLKANKKAAGRLKDLLDVKKLNDLNK